MYIIYIYIVWTRPSSANLLFEMLAPLTLACLVAPISALAVQPAHARMAAPNAARSAVSMQVDWEARKAAEEQEAADAHAKLMAHLRAPIRQYEGGWADTALRGGGKDADRFGTGPDANLGVEFKEAHSFLSNPFSLCVAHLSAHISKSVIQKTQDGEELLENTHHASLRDVGRRIGKYSSADMALPKDKVDQLVLPEASWKVAKMAVSQTDEDLVMVCPPGEEAQLVIDVKPMFITKTEYFYGFTSDSDAKISIDRKLSSHIEGEMPAKGHQGQVDDEDDLKIHLKFTPESATGEFVAHLCVMLPSEKAFSKFYKITGKSS